jgi:hypothetical protein
MADYVDEGLRKMGISISKPILAIVCIVSGLLVILFPALVAWIIGLFLVIQGALLLTDHLEQERRTTVTATPRGVQCTACGTTSMTGAVYCKNCGNKLSKTDQAVLVPPQPQPVPQPQHQPQPTAQ